MEPGIRKYSLLGFRSVVAVNRVLDIPMAVLTLRRTTVVPNAVNSEGSERKGLGPQISKT